MEFYGRHITESIRNNIDSMADMTRYLLSSSNVLNSLYMLAAWHTSENIDEVYYRGSDRDHRCQHEYRLY